MVWVGSAFTLAPSLSGLEIIAGLPGWSDPSLGLLAWREVFPAWLSTSGSLRRPAAFQPGTVHWTAKPSSALNIYQSTK